MLSFYFHNSYSVNEIDAINYIEAYLITLIITYAGWKTKQECDINPIVIKSIVFLSIIILIIWESSLISYPRILAKIIFCFLGCFFLEHVLNKIYNNL
ncbi:hypothetical protein IJ843_07250 [bacterium]|nr:hypothetical protein [bacterium]